MSKVICVCLHFALQRLVIGLKISRHFFNQSESETKTNCDLLTHVFPRFASATSTSGFDWFTGWSAFFLIGQNDYFGFWFHDTQLKSSLIQCIISHSAFVAYLGFVTVLVAHRHPVMLVFCQLLLDRNKDQQPLQERKSWCEVYPYIVYDTLKGNSLHVTDILYGYKPDCTKFYALNHVLIFVKYHIFQAWLDNSPPSFEIFHLVLKDKILCECRIAFKNNMLSKFRSIWTKLCALASQSVSTYNVLPAFFLPVSSFLSFFFPNSFFFLAINCNLSNLLYTNFVLICSKMA